MKRLSLLAALVVVLFANIAGVFLLSAKPVSAAVDPVTCTPEALEKYHGRIVATDGSDIPENFDLSRTKIEINRCPNGHSSNAGTYQFLKMDRNANDSIRFYWKHVALDKRIQIQYKDLGGNPDVVTGDYQFEGEGVGDNGVFLDNKDKLDAVIRFFHDPKDVIDPNTAATYSALQNQSNEQVLQGGFNVASFSVVYYNKDAPVNLQFNAQIPGVYRFYDIDKVEYSGAFYCRLSYKKDVEDVRAYLDLFFNASDKKFYRSDITGGPGFPGADTVLTTLSNDANVNGIQLETVFQAITDEECESTIATDTAVAASSAGALGTGEGDDNATCEANGNPMSWLFCPLINGLATAADKTFELLIVPLLRTKPIDFENVSEDITFQVWSSFRILGNIILVIALLILVFGQSIGGGLLDAYTAKKMAPRILTAAILINLSIYIVALLSDLTNVLGAGMQALITAPVEDAGRLTIAFGAGSQAAGLLGLNALAGAAFLVIGAGGGPTLLLFLLLFVLLPAFIAMLGVFITLILRRGLILFLIVISPIAFALYVLPATEQYFRKWWSLLTKTLLIYPFIAAVFAIADVLSALLAPGNSTSQDNIVSKGAAGLISEFAAVVITVIPMFLIPFSFKIIGGALATLYAAITSPGRKGLEYLKGNPNDKTSLRNRTRERLGQSYARGAGKYIHSAEERGGSEVMGGRTRFGRFTARKFGSAFGRFYNADLAISRANKRERDESEEISETGDDAYRYAAAGFQWNHADQVIADRNGNTLRFQRGKFYNSKGAEISEPLFRNAKRWQGRTTPEIGTNLEYTARKAKTDLHHAALRIAMTENARAQGWDPQEFVQTQAQAMYPHKGTGAWQWFSKGEVQPDGSVTWHDVGNDTEQGDAAFDEMSSEHQKMLVAYQLSTLQDGTWRAYEAKQRQVEDRLLANNYVDKVDRKGKPVSATQQRQKDLDRLGRIYEVADAATYEQATLTHTEGTGADAKVSASGATPASQPIIRRLKTNRRFDFGDTAADGAREIVTNPGGPIPALPAGAVPPPPGGRLKVGETYTTGGDTDRSAIPRNT